MEFPILFEDKDLVVINKPAGIVVNNAESTHNLETVQDWAIHHIRIVKPQDKIIKKYGEDGWDPHDDFYDRGGIVHRLDKETSGVLILAKNPQAFVAMLEQFREREIQKTYHAFAHGAIEPMEGEINVPVGRLPWNKKSFGIIPGGKESITLYKVLDYYENPSTKEMMSFVSLFPKSGRTHQIRVHLKYIHHPIFSDFLYAGRKTSRNDRKVLQRVFLHAATITFKHPQTGIELTCTAPLPDELLQCLSQFTKK